MSNYRTGKPKVNEPFYPPYTGPYKPRTRGDKRIANMIATEIIKWLPSDMSTQLEFFNLIYSKLHANRDDNAYKDPVIPSPSNAREINNLLDAMSKRGITCTPDPVVFCRNLLGNPIQRERIHIVALLLSDKELAKYGLELSVSKIENEENKFKIELSSSNSKLSVFEIVDFSNIRNCMRPKNPTRRIGRRSHSTERNI